MNPDGHRALIVGPGEFDIVPSVARAFARLGWETCCYAYQLRRSPARRCIWRLLSWLDLHLHLMLRPLFQEQWYNIWLRQDVLPGAIVQPPDLLLFFRAYRLRPDTRRLLASLRRPLVTWATDSLSRFGRHAGLWDIAAVNYVFDGADLTANSSKWLPLGYDDEVFRPGDHRDLDVLFLGRISGQDYRKRLAFFHELAFSDLPATRRVAQAGWGLNRFRSLSEQFRGKGGVCLGHLSMADLARAISRAKIAVSIHHDDGQQPVNPMFFAIPGCRTCLVTDRRDYLAQWLRPEQDFVPATPADFIQRVEELLRNERARMKLAEQGFQAASQHTWTKRIRTVLEDLELPRQGTPKAQGR